MSDSAFEKLNDVQDAATFVDFLETLLNDLPSKDAIAKESSTGLYFGGINGWMNQDLWSFLEASIAGGKDNKNKIGVAAESSEHAWRAAAEIHYCGKIYE